MNFEVHNPLLKFKKTFCMNKNYFIALLLFTCMLYSQRGKTGDKTFENRFPEELFNDVSNSSLELINEVDHDLSLIHI